MDSGSGTGSATGSSENSPSLQPSELIMAKEPLWKHVTVTEKFTGGTLKFRCNFCNQIFSGSMTRIKAHLLRISGKGIKGCTSVTTEMQIQFQRELDEAEETNKPRGNIPLPPSIDKISSSSRSSGGCGTKRQNIGNPIERAFNNNERAQIDAEIAKLFYSAGMPFHVARNPHFIQAFRMCANSHISGYSPPSYNALRTTLLAKEKADLEISLSAIKSTWRTKGVSIVSDGWTDIQRRPLINFMAVSESGPMFLKAVNCEGQYKDRFFIANLLKEVIMEVGPQYVVQVITDNAPVCKAAGALVEDWFPHIFWTPCVVHSLNLALKNICAAKDIENNEVVYEQCHWITEMIDRAAQIKNFVMNHQKRLAMFNKFSSLKLLSIAETRFASTLIMLRRLKLLKRSLEAMVLDEEWTSYREDDREKAAGVKSTILDEMWWDNVDYILTFTAPIYDMLRKADTDKPCLHLVYDMWDTMIENVKDVIYKHEKREIVDESPFYDVIYGVLVDRWTKSSSPLQCLAHSLNPRYYSDVWLTAGVNRVAPHEDFELSEERNKCFRRLCGSNEEARRALNQEYARFSAMMDVFGEPYSLLDRGVQEPKMWWNVYGASAPNLLKLANKLLGQPCSSSCAERNWSTYSFIHSLRRNKTLPERAEQLVFVHNNLRLLSRSREEYKKGATKLWDIGGDAFDSLGGADELEIAELTMDEPELEAMIVGEHAINE